MKTWSLERGEDKICPQCESTYSVRYHQVPVKDVDSANCSVCGHELDRWKSTRYPIFELKTRGKWPKPEVVVSD
jgi:predicted Zn finger-like uncharacterized protein